MAKLTLSRDEASARIQNQIVKGQELLSRPVESRSELKQIRQSYYTWDEYNVELLKKLFETEVEAEAYARRPGIFIAGNSSLEEDIEDFHDDVRSRIRRLDSLAERLELFDEPGSGGVVTGGSQAEIARRLIETLDRIQASNYQDEQLIQEAKNLNAMLSPTYTRMHGAVPVITTTYPPRIWWPRAREEASQALAMASARQLATPEPSSKRPPERAPSNRVFLVHGRDHGLKEAVARLVDRIGYKPIILHERPDRGQTIIEKFEREAPDAAYAIVLLTPDDVGRLAAEPEAPLGTRARQNVVWEFGYFAALLGRDHVAALVVSADELVRPTDIEGILYISVRDIEDDAWRMKLAREMKSAGLDVDLNNID
jgi:predicted nucleotide-binding protein